MDSADRLIHRYWYERVMLHFAVATPSLQRLLGPEWVVAERLGGSNVTIGLCDVSFDADNDGKPLTPSRYLYVPVNGMVEHASDGSEVDMRYLTLADDTAAFPQFAVEAVDAEQSKTVDRHGPAGHVTERYRFHSDSYEVALDIAYKTGPARRLGGGMDVRCPDDISFRQRYENEELQHPLRRGTSTW